MRWSLMGIVGSLSLSLVGCAGQADVSLAMGSTDELALSVEETAEAEAGAAVSEAALLLHVIRTEVHVAAMGAGDAEGEPADEAAEEEGGQGFVVLSEEARDVDLYALSGSAEEIASGPVPSGRLTQIRLILDAENPATLVADGEETPVAVPSGAESGLKLYAAPPVVLEDGSAVELGVEFGGLVGSGAGGLVLTPALALTGGSGPVPAGAGGEAR